MKNQIKHFLIMLLLGAVCISITACGKDKEIESALSSTDESSDGAITEGNGGNNLFYSTVTFSASLDTLFYYVTQQFDTSWQEGTLIVHYEPKTGTPESAELKLTNLNEKYAKLRVESILNNTELSKFLSNPSYTPDPEFDGDDNYYVMADLDLSTAEINTFIEAYYLLEQDVLALQHDCEESEGMSNFLEIGENYTYDGYRDLRIEWFK